jgi:transcriptional regulator with XRE-family HTH domain
MREDAGLTLEDFADDARLRFQLLSDLEGGLTDPKLSTLLRFGEGADIKLGELFARMEMNRDGE